MFADKREKNKELSPRWKRTKERTQNLVFKYKEQRAELSSWLLPSHALLFIGKEKQNYKEKQTLETYQPISPLF
jgi:hypothetical protein